MPKIVSLARLLTWAAISLYLVAIVGIAGQPSGPAQALAAGAITIAFGLSVITYGWAGSISMLAICLTITFLVENIGVLTGLPFGHYHFEVGGALPHIGFIPIIVGPLYFGVGFLAWTIAGIVLDDADLHLDRRMNVIALPIIASFVMVQWDAVMDPSNATLAHAWIWHDGGGYFGVPLSNYLGWYGTVWLYFQAFAVMMHRWPRLFARRSNRLLAEARLVATLIYLAIGLSHLVPYLSLGDAVVTDASGRVWQAGDIRETSVIVMAVTMVPSAMLALLCLIKRSRPEPRTLSPSGSSR
jgi:uncharacterized membrane protein